jgi:hypothetical protein
LKTRKEFVERNYRTRKKGLDANDQRMDFLKETASWQKLMKNVNADPRGSRPGQDAIDRHGAKMSVIRIGTLSEVRRSSFAAMWR